MIRPRRFELRWIVFFFFLAPIPSQGLEVPRSLQAGSTGWNEQALSSACYSMSNWTATLPCNPALLHSSRHRYGHLFFGSSDWSYLQDLQDLINERSDRSTLERMLSQNRGVTLQADLEIGSLQDNWTWSVSPSRLTYYSLVRNQAMPFVSLYAAQEQILRLQHSWALTSQWHAGLQVRAVHRRWIESEFFLTDALVEGGPERVLPVRQKTLFHFEPGVTWSAKSDPSAPRFSAALMNTGIAPDPDRTRIDDPRGQFGAAFRPGPEASNWEVALQATISNRARELRQDLSIASQYQYEAWVFAGNWGSEQQDLGFHWTWKALKAGFIWDRRQIENIQGRQDEVQTAFWELGLAL